MSNPNVSYDRLKETSGKARPLLPAIGFAAVVLCLALLFALVGLPADRTSTAGPRPQADAVVRCDPQSVTAYTDEIATVDLYTQDVENLYAVDLQLSFIPGIAHVVDLDPGTDLAQFEPLYVFLDPTVVLSNTADNSLGTIKYIASQMAIWPPPPPVDGSGPLARLQFEADQAGTIYLNWTVDKLSTEEGEDIPNTTIPCTITFQYPTAIELLTFTTTSGPGHAVTLHWKAAEELNILSYNVYRSESPEGQQELVNPVPIPSTDFGRVTETAYTYVDSETIPLTTYYYWLELVHAIGPDSVYGPEGVTTSLFRMHLPIVGR